MTDTVSGGITRRGLLGAFAATAVTAAPTFANAAGFLRGGGDIRRIKMYSGRTGERIDMIYWVEGKYVKEAVQEMRGEKVQKQVESKVEFDFDAFLPESYIEDGLQRLNFYQRLS